MMIQGNLALKEFANQRQVQQGQRAQEFDRELNKGLDNLAQARTQKFKNIAQVQKSCHYFITAAQYNRRDPRPLIYLAYTVMIFEKFEEASDYLKEALRLQPDNTDAQFMLTFALKMKAQNQQKLKVQQPILPKQTQDFDRLYHDLEQYIYAKLKSLMEETGPIVPCLEPHKEAAMRGKLESLEKALDAIQIQFRVLEKEIEIGNLALKIRPLEQLYNRYKKALNASKNMQQLMANLQSLKQRVFELHQEIEANPEFIEAYESRVEAALDQLDGLADQLDDMDQQGISIAELEPEYEQLVTRLTRVQDLLDQW